MHNYRSNHEPGNNEIHLNLITHSYK